MSNVRWQGYNAADTPFGTTLNSLASGSYVLSGAIDNTASDSSGGLFLYADPLLNLGAGVTAGAGSPMVQIYALYAPDGTTFPNPPGASGSAAGGHMLAATGLLVPSASFQSVTFPQIVLRPAKMKLMIYNGSGVAFPASGVTFALYRYGEQAS